MSLYCLPNEVLLIIFNYLDENSLAQLACVCRRFNLLISDILDKRSNYLLVTNQVSEKFRERCKPLLSSYSSKFFTHYNWINGRWNKVNKICAASASRDRRITDCKIKMTPNRLFFFYNNKLFAYNRAEDGIFGRNKENNNINEHCDYGICDITCRNDVIITAHVNGNIQYWKIVKSRKKINFLRLLKNSHVNDCIINNITATSQCIAISSKNRSLIKIQKITQEDIPAKWYQIFNRGMTVRSIAFDPTGQKLAGTYNYFKDSDFLLHSSYIIYDINNSHLSEIHGERGTCIQLLWEDPHTILACYKQSIKKIDIRTSRVVCTWNAPNQDILTCISSDNLYTMMTGIGYNKQGVMLWDQRKISHVKIYNVTNFEGIEEHTTIRSVEFDSCHLYITTSGGYLYEFDFTRNNFDHA